MDNVLKFRKASASANDADEAYYVPVSKVEHVSTAANEVVVYTLARGANVSAYDTITIACGAGDELAIADKLTAAMYGNKSNGSPVTVGVEFYSGITAITYTPV